MLQVWLPPVDLQQGAAAASVSQPVLQIPTEAEVSQQMRWTSEQDVYGIVLSNFSDLPAGKELACMALRFHYEVQVSRKMAYAYSEFADTAGYHLTL